MPDKVNFLFSVYELLAYKRKKPSDKSLLKRLLLGFIG